MTGPTLVARRGGVDVRTGVGQASGTFGELLQGRLPGGADFLVTFPITRRTRAWFRLDPHGTLRVYPSHKTKSLRLAAAMMATHGGGTGGTLVLDSDLPIGKGLASSSADLVATARAVGAVLGLPTSPEAVQDWLRPIEPTDGVMHSGIVAFEHREVRLHAVLGTLPPATVVAVDEGGLLDTVAFNGVPKEFAPWQTAEYAGLLERLADAVRAGDLAAVGAVATRSSVLNQRLAPKRNLAAMLRIGREQGAAGVVCTHSGTMLGLLFPDGTSPRRLDAARAACSRLPGTVLIFRTLTC